MRFSLVAVVLALIPAAAAAQASAGTAGGPLREAGFEDYRTPAGRLEGGVLRLTLTASVAAWRPWGPDGPVIPANVFVPDGGAPRVPAPLIRVTAGTPVHVTLRNALPDTVVVRGLRDRSASRPAGPPFGALFPDPVTVAPGETKEVRFTPTVPGTFFYFGVRLQPPTPEIPRQPFSVERGPFEGALLVDPPGTTPDPNERIFLITHWADRALPGSWLPSVRFMINGLAWPHTERLQYAQGDTVRWRVINATGSNHPMHLHGFHFRVDARGDSWREDLYAPGDRRLAVTENLLPSETIRLSWVAHEPGNWVFHCHLMRHMSWIQTAPLEHEPDAHHPPDSRTDALGGLVLGVTITHAAERAIEPKVRRRLPLHIGRRASVFGREPAYSFVLQENAAPPAPDSVRFPGSTIVVTRGEPSEIVIHNHADVPLGVHWHGLELESWADGVPGWSGSPASPIPAVAPGDSFAVRITPPRAGSFMYHVHSEPGHQLSQGLYGAFLVLEPGQTWDPETDRIFLLGSLGAGLNPPAALNGQTAPGPIEVRAGTKYRLRFMHISPDDQKTVRLLGAGGPVRWRALAKDGADLPQTLAGTGPADLRIDVGETYDFEWTPEHPADLTLRIITVFPTGPAGFVPPGPSPDTMDVPVRVR